MTEQFSLTLTGDTILGSRIPGVVEAIDPRVRELVQDSDIAFTNMEFVSVPPGVHQTKMEHFPLGTASDSVVDVQRLGFELVSLANNHAGDFAEAGLQNTIAELDQLGLTHAGAGANLRQARSASFRYVGERKVALVAVTCSGTEYAAADPLGALGGRFGVSTLAHSTTHELTDTEFTQLRDMTSALGVLQSSERRLALGLGRPASSLPTDEMKLFRERFVRSSQTRLTTRAVRTELDQVCLWIADAASRADIVVVSVHCHEGPRGDWNSAEPADFLLESVERFAQAGASLVVGHGPHMLRGIHSVHGVPILLSLGNFISMIDSFDYLGPETFHGHDLDVGATPGQLHGRRIADRDGKPIGFDADSRFWESVVARARLDERGRVTSLAVHPITLWPSEQEQQWGRVGTKGIPRTPEREQGLAILTYLDSLSQAEYPGAVEGAAFELVEEGDRVFGRYTFGD